MQSVDSVNALDAVAVGERDNKVVVPITTETIAVGKEEVVTGGVHVRKIVTEHEEVVDEALMRQNIEVTRVPINQFVDAAPAVRYEGDTMIVSVVEEVLVTQKRLRVTEEIHLTQRRSEYHEPQTVALKSEEVAIERWQEASGEGS